MRYFFTTPTVEEGPAGDDRLFYRYRLPRADTILKDASGAYSHFRTPGLEQLEAAVLFYQGGHINEVSASEAADLTAAGYGAYITTEA